MDEEGQVRHVIDGRRMPALFPTQLHEPMFWEALGRAVATFGFLEETLSKAIFAFTATKPYPEDEIEAAFVAWVPTLERALTDQLGALIGAYEKAVRAHPKATITNLVELLADLREGAKIRNVLCHGSWRAPSPSGASVPLFVNRAKEVFATEIDVDYLVEIRKQTVGLICAVINSVTHMGWQFPGSSSPGQVIWERHQPQ